MARPTPDLPGVMKAWDYAVAKLKQGDVAAGLAVLQNVIACKPNDVAQRRALRETERDLHRQHKEDESAAALVLMEVWSEIHQARHKREGDFVDWDAIDRAAERGLAVNPWDLDLNLELARACSARGYREAARFAYECALETAPDRADVRKCFEDCSV